MSKNTDRLLNLTNQLLDFQKTESDAYLLNLEPENVSKLIRETYLRFTPFAKQKKLLFELSLPEDDLLVQVDKEAFLKIISNLINNGIRYCDSYVRLNAHIDEEEPKTFHLYIENDGEKIPDKYKEEIFKPFVHLDKERDRAKNGTGIGLALSRSLAELHKGKIELEASDDSILFHLSIPVGNITAMVATLPDKQEKDTPEEFAGKPSRPTILLVDDDRELLHFEKK